MKKWFLIILMITIQSFLFSLDFKVESCELDVKDLRNATGKVTDADKKPCAVLRLETDVKPELFLSGASIVKREKIAPGQFYFYLSARDTYITFSAEGYTPYTYKLPVKLEAGRTYKIIVSSEDEFNKNGLAVMIKTIPENAQIFLNNKEAGLSGKTLKLSKGEHNLKIGLKGYKTIEKKIVVDESNIYFEYLLETVEPVDISFSSNPSDADLYIDQINMAKTPARLKLIPGVHEVKITRRDYVDYIAQVDITEKDNIDYHFDLKENSGYLKITLSPSDAEILIDEEEYTGDTRIKLKAGLHTIEIQKNGYIAQKLEVNVIQGQELNKSVSLKDNSGVLNLTTLPEKSRIYINKAEYTGKKPIKLTAGRYIVDVKSDGYFTQTFEVKIETGKRIDKNIVLSPGYSKMDFSGVPTEAQIILKKNGKVSKTWKGNGMFEDIPTGDILIEAKAQGYKSKKQNFHIQEKENNIVHFEMQKGSDMPSSFVFVEGGSYTAGDTKGTGLENETPVHKATVSSFYINKYEVTVAEFRKFVLATNYKTEAERGVPSLVFVKEWVNKSDASWLNPYYPVKDNYPVTCISWKDAVAYCNWKSQQEKLTLCYTTEGEKIECDLMADGYRLPTELEWEFAARGGLKSKNYEYSGSNNPLEVAWSKENSGGHPQPVGTKTPNELGLYDMSGNVDEFCTVIHELYNARDIADVALYKSFFNRGWRIVRNGDWGHPSENCRVSKRDCTPVINSTSHTGFRLVRKVQ